MMKWIFSMSTYLLQFCLHVFYKIKKEPFHAPIVASYENRNNGPTEWLSVPKSKKRDFVTEDVKSNYCESMSIVMLWLAIPSFCL